MGKASMAAALVAFVVLVGMWYGFVSLLTYAMSLNPSLLTLSGALWLLGLIFLFIICIPITILLVGVILAAIGWHFITSKAKGWLKGSQRSR